MSGTELTVEEMRRYIAGANGERGHTQHDYIVDVFWEMRRELPVQGWHRIDGIREFCGEISDYNPFVPPVVAQMEHLSRQSARNNVSFTDDWEADGHALETLTIAMDDFLKTLKADPESTARMLRQSGKNAGRLYAKMAEWHVAVSAAEAAGAKTIVDLGTTDNGFARVAAARLGPDVRVDMVDINNPAGRREVSAQLHKVGADARDMSVYEDASVDMVCMLNSLEHFTGQRDSQAIAEVQRILKPGGQVVVVPFRGESDYILSVQPISCFLAPLDESIAEDVENEVRRGECLVRYNHGIISPFARTYDYAAARRRVLDKVPDMTPTLQQIRFADGSENVVTGDDIPAMPASFAGRQDILALTLTKPAR